MAKRMKSTPPEMEWSVCGTNKGVFHDEDLNGKQNEEDTARDGDDAGRQHAREVVPSQNTAERGYDIPCSRAENHYSVREWAEGAVPEEMGWVPARAIVENCDRSPHSAKKTMMNVLKTICG